MCLSRTLPNCFFPLYFFPFIFFFFCSLKLCLRRKDQLVKIRRIWVKSLKAMKIGGWRKTEEFQFYFAYFLLHSMFQRANGWEWLRKKRSQHNCDIQRPLSQGKKKLELWREEFNIIQFFKVIISNRTPFLYL